MTLHKTCKTLIYPIVHHTLALSVAIFRLLLALFYSGKWRTLDQTHIFLAVLSAAPYMIMFWMFSLLIFQWADIVHYAMRSGGRGKTLRPVFIILNLTLSLFVFAMFISLVEFSDKRGDISLAGSCIMSFVTVSTAVSYVIYGSSLYRALRKGPQGALAQKLFIASTIFCVSFTGESIIWLISVLSSSSFINNSDLIVAIYLGFDVVSIVTLLLLFNRTISDTTETEKNSQTDNSASGERDRTIHGPNTHYARQPNSPKHSRREDASSDFEVPHI